MCTFRRELTARLCFTKAAPLAIKAQTKAEARDLLVSLRRDLSSRMCFMPRIRIDLAVTGCNGELTYFVTTVAVYRRCKVVVTEALAGYV